MTWALWQTPALAWAGLCGARRFGPERETMAKPVEEAGHRLARVDPPRGDGEPKRQEDEGAMTREWFRQSVRPIGVSVFGNVSRLIVASVLLLALPACVPLNRYEDSESKLAIANKVNRDLENQLKNAAIEVAKAQGGAGISRAAYDAMETKLEGARTENDALREENARLRAQLQNIPELPLATGFTAEEVKDIPGVSVEEGRLIMEGDILFDPGKEELKPGSKRTLDSVGKLIKDNHSHEIVHIYGHTDNDPIKRSPHKHNWDLGSKRAIAVFGYLMGLGIQDTSMRIHSAGFAEPANGVDPNSREGKAKCRRVEIRVSPAVR